MNCTNNQGLPNLQPANCIITPKITRKFIFVEYFLASGAVNGLSLATPVTETIIDALIAQTNKALRWYPTDSISNFLTERADPNVETIDNIDRIVSQGARTMSGDFLSTSSVLAKKINDTNRTDIGVYLVDDDNGLTGIVNRDGFLDPIRLERNAFGRVVFPTETNVFKVSYSSTWGKFVEDGDVRTLCFDDHNTNLLSKKGLVDVKNRAVSSPSSTTVKASLYIQNGNAEGIDYTGLVVGDFTAMNTTTNTAIPITSIVESPDGTYTFTLSGAQVTGQLGTITTVKAGFEFEVIDVVFA